MESIHTTNGESEYLSMTERQDISDRLGRLETNIEHLLKTTDHILDRFEKSNERVIHVERDAQSAHNRIDKIEPKVEHHEAVKNKIAGASLISGGVGGFLVLLGTWVVKALF